MIRMLKNKKKYGGAHTETVHLRNCVPRHVRGTKIIDEAIRDLFEENRGLSPTINGGDSPARFLANSRGHSSPHLKEGDFCHSNLNEEF